MKRFVWLCCLFWVFMAGAALAGEMPDITGQCTVSATSRYDPTSYILDGKITTVFRWNKGTVVTVKPKAAVYGIYLQWDEAPGTWALQVSRGGVWETVYTGGVHGFLHEFVPVEGLLETFRLLTASEKALSPLAEITFLGEGDTLPAWVQDWRETPEKASLMAISAHCDDELVFMGGILPRYAGEEGRDTVVVYMCGSNARRRHEALNGIWACGVTQYPVFGAFRDFRTETLADAYSKWGKAKTRTFMMEVIRRYRPDVIVTHDVNGEYGHGAHRLTADVALYCLQNGNDPTAEPESFETYGGWQPLKAYLHLYAQGAITLDFDQPLARFGGRTGREVADDAFKFHVSQQSIKFRAADRGAYDCAKWGLAFTQVGEDMAKNDLFENLDPVIAAEVFEVVDIIAEEDPVQQEAAPAWSDETIIF